MLLLLPLLLQSGGALDPVPVLLLGQRGKMCSAFFLLSSPFVKGSVWLNYILCYSPAAVAWNICVVWLTLVAIA